MLLLVMMQLALSFQIIKKIIRFCRVFLKNPAITIEKINSVVYDKIMEWKTIENFENYQVSDTGLIRNKKTNLILKTTIKRKHSLYGYEMVYLYNNQGRKCFMVHRLVALAFIPNPNNYPQINHKDENSLNNNVSNLEWCTAKYNANYGTIGERKRIYMSQNNPFKGKHHSNETKQKMSNAKLGKPNPRRKKVTIDGVEYVSITQAMKQLHLSTRAFYKLLNKQGEK